ncbi:hypothetical protein GEMRC1_010246 [Eukaryota sp. GEM-RC1]
MEHNTGERTVVISPSRGRDPPHHSFSSKAGEEPHVSTPRPSHEEYELPSEAPFIAEIATVANSTTEADIKQAFSSLHVKEVRSSSNMLDTFFVEFLDVQGLKQSLDKYWMFKIHGRPIRTYVASAPQSSVEPLNTSTFSFKPNAEPKPLIPLTSSFQSPSSCLHFQQSLLILIHFHMLSKMLKSILECDEYRCGDLHKLKKDLLPVFKKVAYLSHHFLESALLATKVFFKTNIFHTIPEDLPQLCSFASFFEANIQSVFLHVSGSFDVEEFLSYSPIISGLELVLTNHNDLEFLSNSSSYFPLLNQLHVSVDRSISVSFIELLTENTSITSINLKDNSIGHEGVRALAEALKVNTTVTSIDLSKNFIGDEGARILADVLKINTTISNINLGDNSIGVEGARALAEVLKVNTEVSSINLCKNSVGAGGASALAEALKVNVTVKSINLWKNSIGAEGFEALSEALKFNTSVKDINLFNNSIGAAAVRVFADALKVNTTITNINLGDNSIGAVGATALAEALKVNTTITSIHLSMNSVGNEGATALAEALKVNTTITSIGLIKNSIGDEGARSLAESFKVNTTIATINMDFNSTSVEGARAFAEALKVNTTITNIGMVNNSIRAEGAKALADALKLNRTVSSIYLRYNSIGSEGAKALEEALKVNSIVEIDY